MIRRDVNKAEARYLADRMKGDSAHKVRVLGGPKGGRYGADCQTCGWGTGQHQSRPDAVDSAEAHRIFTHVTGSYLCGSPRKCQGCEAVLRLRDRLGLLPAYPHQPPHDPMRHLGVSEVPRVLGDNA